LGLVPSSEQFVKEEFELIAALSALSEYNVSILPLQGMLARNWTLALLTISHSRLQQCGTTKECFYFGF
jgi:hypothetical protein